MKYITSKVVVDVGSPNAVDHKFTRCEVVQEEQETLPTGVPY